MEFYLKRGEELLGVLRLTGSDFPWVNCEFEPTAAFAGVQPVFQEELRLLESDNMDAWQMAYDEINALGLQLIVARDETVISEFVLHIYGNEASFRY
jgi:hypothetical protein